MPEITQADIDAVNRLKESRASCNSEADVTTLLQVALAAHREAAVAEERERCLAALEQLHNAYASLGHAGSTTICNCIAAIKRGTTPPEPRALTAEKVKSIAFEWTGDLDDDCFCEWNGLSLHAEAMDDDVWWWAVYRGKHEIASSNDEGGWTGGKNGGMARRFAEHVAMRVQLVATLGIDAGVKHG